ncbi:hypothetical protein ACIQUX_32490 [Streptomyces sp. NPDC101133]|uniref:hypothetical protein n=1 Tax=Streptomyces sp. NPDC101133 TaxID=3366111 RepID=UPI00380964BD
MLDNEVNCDDFPFASTYQSAGMKIPEGKNPAPNGGADCMQTVAAQTDDGTEHLLDDTRYDPPAFTENCGRSSMSGKINQGSMSHFGEFARQLRLIDETATCSTRATPGSGGVTPPRPTSSAR